MLNQKFKEVELTPINRFDASVEMKVARVLQARHFEDLNYPNKGQHQAFPSYTCMVQFAEQNECKRILEIGSGLSTAVWAGFAQRTGAEVCTIDADLSRMQSYIRGTRHEALVARHVNMIEGVTIDSEEFMDFYFGIPLTTYAGVEVAGLRAHIDSLRSSTCSIKRRYQIGKIAEKFNWSTRDLMTTETTLMLSRRLLDLFSCNGNFDNEVNYLRESEAAGKAGVISQLVGGSAAWDMVFFDSGELASMIEWQNLKKHIVVGGYAAFHDIYFPKSLKNIIPCAAILADSNWEMVFCDNSTRQGLFIARRLA